jgi:AcrR family transcriptional regulator
MPAPHSSSDEPKRSRGRPARLSATAVVEAALALLSTESIEQVTLARIADRLGVSTMSLYTYFPNRDALLEAVASHAFEQLALPEADLDWRGNLRAWLWAVQRHFERHPIVAKTLGWDGRVPAAWLRVAVPVIKELQRQGLEGERLVFALNWFMSSAVGLMLTELSAPAYRDPFALGTLDKLSPSEQDTLLTLRQQWGVDRDKLLEFGFEHLLDGLATLLPVQGSKERGRTRSRQ